MLATPFSEKPWNIVNAVLYNWNTLSHFKKVNMWDNGCFNYISGAILSKFIHRSSSTL